LSSDEEKTNDTNDSSENSQKGLILKLGQNLLKTKTIRNNEETTTTSDVLNSNFQTVKLISTQSTTKTAALISNSSPSTQIKSKNLLEKFSFLKKDQSYLNRISSYVNKTLNLNSGSGAVKNETKKVNNMVFSRLSQMPAEEIKNEVIL
jgi:hypothetical protein